MISNRHSMTLIQKQLLPPPPPPPPPPLLLRLWIRPSASISSATLVFLGGLDWIAYYWRVCLSSLSAWSHGSYISAAVPTMSHNCSSVYRKGRSSRSKKKNIRRCHLYYQDTIIMIPIIKHWNRKDSPLRPDDDGKLKHYYSPFIVCTGNEKRTNTIMQIMREF